MDVALSDRVVAPGLVVALVPVLAPATAAVALCVRASSPPLGLALAEAPVPVGVALADRANLLPLWPAVVSAVALPAAPSSVRCCSWPPPGFFFVLPLTVLAAAARPPPPPPPCAGAGGVVLRSGTVGAGGGAELVPFLLSRPVPPTHLPAASGVPLSAVVGAAVLLSPVGGWSPLVTGVPALVPASSLAAGCVPLSVMGSAGGV